MMIGRQESSNQRSDTLVQDRRPQASPSPLATRGRTIQFRTRVALVVDQQRRKHSSTKSDASSETLGAGERTARKVLVIWRILGGRLQGLDRMVGGDRVKATEPTEECGIDGAVAFAAVWQICRQMS